MLKIREIICKTLLNKSSLADFTLNCYVGCSHRCLYCYAGYMKKFKNRPENWGDFVDVKVNAAQVLAQQVKKVKPGLSVLMSSVCDGWQPLEAKYRLSRECLKILLERGFAVDILTKSSLVLRDFDLLSAYKNLRLGMTITTLNQGLQTVLEPDASPIPERLNTLKKATKLGIKTYVFCGPILPELTDTRENLEAIFQASKDLDLEQIYLDRLNLRWGVLQQLKKGLSSRGECLDLRLLLYKTTNPAKYAEYSRQLKEKTAELACRFNLSNKLTFCF